MGGRCRPLGNVHGAAGANARKDPACETPESSPAPASFAYVSRQTAVEAASSQPHLRPMVRALRAWILP